MTVPPPPEQIPTTTPGIYGVELFGDGPSGPVVVLNVNVSAGVPEPTDSSIAPVGEGATPAMVEARLFELINEARTRAGATRLESDDALARVARAHSEDMKAHSFVGHVSTTTGTVFDRVRVAGIQVAKVGENIAMNVSADAVHDGLMNSPGHRAIIVDRDFTHVGMGVVVGSTNGRSVFFVTQVFGVRR